MEFRHLLRELTGGRSQAFAQPGGEERVRYPVHPAANADQLLSEECLEGRAHRSGRRESDVASDALGMYALRAEDLSLSGGPAPRLVLSRPPELSPARPTRVRLDTLLATGENEPPKLVESEVELPADGSKVVLVWRGSAWVSGSS